MIYFVFHFTGILFCKSCLLIIRLFISNLKHKLWVSFKNIIVYQYSCKCIKNTLNKSNYFLIYNIFLIFIQIYFL